MSHNKRPNFLQTEEAAHVKKQLKLMEADENYNTKASYSANSKLYPDNSISFCEKHMNYLQTHPTVDCMYYLSNLRLITRVRNDG